MTIQLVQAEKLCEAVRTAFKRGYKSYNKIYPKGHAKYELRNAQALESRPLAERYRATGTHWAMAQTMSKVPLNTLAGNCLEMAVLAAYGAQVLDKARDGTAYIGKVSEGAHAFCLLTKSDVDFTKYNLSNVSSFFGVRDALEWIIVDPWLRVTCIARHYVKYAAASLLKWQLDGKLIRLNEETTSEPTELFFDVLLNEPVTVKKYEDEQSDVDALMAELCCQ